MQQALDAAARASKGFSLHLCTQARPHIGDLLAGPLQAAISIPQVCLPAKPRSFLAVGDRIAESHST